VAARATGLPVRLLFWWLAGGALIFLVLRGPLQPVPSAASPIFWYLLKAFDPAGNALLLVLAVGAYALRGQPVLPPAALARPPGRAWMLAAALFALLCLGALLVCRARALSMDEFSALFQAQAFAAGHVSGSFPTALADRLLPPGFYNMFLTMSRASGEVSSSYWPGFALLLTPFTWLGIPWAANPLLAALAVPVVYRTGQALTGSREAAAWSALFLVASPVFSLTSMTFYSMPAHLLLNAVYAWLLLRPSAARAIAAGLVGSLALTLHQPLPHTLFALPFILWLAFRGGSLRILLALLAGYLPLGLLLGLAWKLHLTGLASAAAAGAPASGGAVTKLMLDQFGVFVLPTWEMAAVRLAGLTKIWSWGALGIVVLAGWGLWTGRRDTGVRLLAAAFAATVVGYFIVPFDQGHGWGYRYAYSAWFVLPLLSGVALTQGLRDADAGEAAQVRGMAGWAVLLSLVLATGLRLVQVEGFVGRHLSQVPPLAREPEAGVREVIVVNARAGFYAFDLVQNDPFLRGPRIMLVEYGDERLDGFMQQQFPGYARRESGSWGERWAQPMR